MKTILTKPLSVALLLAVTFMLAACGSAGGESAGDGGQSTDKKTGGMGGMDHSNMDHGSMDMGSGDMVMDNGKYSDKRFIDAMVPHHQGAVEMAQVALKNAEHEEVKQLSEDSVSAQEAEIKQLGEIREREFGSAGSPSGMSDMDMQMMGMTDPQKLAKQRPFDRAFIDAMIPHHESAIAMANVALEESENEEIRRIAQDIVGAQKREIAQMRSWRQQWFPEEA